MTEKPEAPGTTVVDENLTIEIHHKSWKYFNQEDPFNPGVVVEGWVNRGPTYYYGSLYIISVNGKPCKQFIPVTPKMHYPYNTDGRFKWPPEITSIDVYDKIDGSNIFQFIYIDDNGNSVVSYKTRLMPFINPGSRYSMYGLWIEILEKYPEIPEMPYILRRLLDGQKGGPVGPVGISYEMYGRKNLILVRYKELLDCRILFYRELSGKRRIFPPTDLYSKEMLGIETVPDNVKLITTIEPDSNLEEEYWKIKNWLDGEITIRCLDCNRLKVIKDDEPNEDQDDEKRFVKHSLTCPKCGDDTEDLVEGMEGCILYANGENGHVQYKVKPEYVLDIHHKGVKGVPTHSILITIKNAFEETDDVTVDMIVKLLEEEFELDNILRKTYTIDRIIMKVRGDRVIRKNFLPLYDAENEKDKDFDINFNKGKVMRFFATKLEDFGLTKRSSTRVFGMLWDYYGIE